ncbi:MAG: hypothetical protein KDI30_00625, partial [Pseudomonadales bacterium]|nr:hypothetical protein [Pseudomonadales bacterium]
RRSPVFLLNTWVPLQQLTRPLCFMDRQTLDQKKHQLRYGLPVEGFLDRDEDRKVNDIWMYLHHDNQQWYYTSDMDASRAYVFDTLGIAHGACVTPGEALAEQYYLQLLKLLEAAKKGDAETLQKETVAAFDVPEATSASLCEALADMKACIEEALASKTLETLNAGWQTKAAAAMDRVVRKSIEMRAVALVF